MADRRKTKISYKSSFFLLKGGGDGVRTRGLIRDRDVILPIDLRPQNYLNGCERTRTFDPTLMKRLLYH